MPKAERMLRCCLSLAVCVVLGWVVPHVKAASWDLSGGALICHHSPGVAFSFDPPSGGWCAGYLNGNQIDSCDDQQPRIDAQAPVVWFVLSAWSEAKEWRGVEFGFSSYNSAAFGFWDWGPCFPGAGLELPSSGWPGPEEGTTFVVTDLSWQGNFVPVYYFTGYPYETDVIQLAVNPASGKGGATNALGLPGTYPWESYGGMGLLTSGVEACWDSVGTMGFAANPFGACCVDEICSILTPADCLDLGGDFHTEAETCEPNPCLDPTSPSSNVDALILESLNWQNRVDCDGPALFTAVAHWLGEQSIEYRVETALDPAAPDSRQVRLWHWMSWIPHVSHLTFTSHFEFFGDVPWLAAEWHPDLQSAMTMAEYWRRFYGLDDQYIRAAICSLPWDPTHPAFAVMLSARTLSEYLRLEDANNAVVIAGAAGSCEAYDAWGLDPAASYLCFSESAFDPSHRCGGLPYLAQCLGCEMRPGRQLYPDAYTCADVAAQQGLVHKPPLPSNPWPELERGGTYGGARDCVLADLVCGHLVACDGAVRFSVTNDGPCLAHLVQGTTTDPGASDPQWETLTIVAPRRSNPGTHLYTAAVPDRAAYRVVSLDPAGRTAISPVVHTGRPVALSDLGEAADPSLPESRLDQDVTLKEYVDGRLQTWRGSSGSTSASLVGPADPADSALCADVIAYTSIDGYQNGFVGRFLEHMAHYPRCKVRFAIGGGTLFGAKVACHLVHNANLRYNAETGTERFPTQHTQHRPLLVILGAPDVVAHSHAPDPDEACGCAPGELCCPTDRDVWDFEGNGHWIGLVHRVPIRSLDELDLCCDAADQWNSGTPPYIDPDRGVVICAGDCGQMLGAYIRDAASDVGAACAAAGYVSTTSLVESAFACGGGAESKRRAYWGALQEGVMATWGVGQAGNRTSWAGGFVPVPNAFGHTPQQRIVCFEPVCGSVALEGGGEPLVRSWMLNDPAETVFAGVVGHLTGGWVRQHVLAERMLADAWVEVRQVPEVDRWRFPLDWVVLWAAERAREQGLSWLAKYFDGVATMGAFVMPHPAGGTMPRSGVVAAAITKDGEWLWTTGSPGRTPTVMLDMAVATQVDIRVYDSTGRHIATLEDGVIGPGVHRRSWAGVDDHGAAVRQGVYFVKVSTGGGASESKQVVLVR